MIIHEKIIYKSFIFLSFLFLFFIINSNSVFAADFKINVGSTEWKINSGGIYKNDSKISCSDIQVGSIPNDGFLVKNSSGTKLFVMAEDNIYVSAKNSFASLTYPSTLENSFILKKLDNDVLLYVDDNGSHYKEGMCDEVGSVCENGILEPGEDCEGDSDCDTPLYKCDNCECVINYDCETSADCDTRFDPGQYACDDCVCTLWNPYGNKPSLVPYDVCFGSSGCEMSTDCNTGDPGDYCDQYAGCTCAVWPPEERPAGTCGGPGPGCFSKGMKVYTPDGNISIEDIKTGDIVYSYNEDTGKLGKSRVGKVFVHEDFRDPAVMLKLLNGILLNSTLNHPFYSSEYRKYLPLEKFDIGDKILFYNNKTGQFEDVEILEFEKVDYFYYEYSLHLEGSLNNYFVNGIIVHNATDIGDKNGGDPLD